LSLTQKTGAFVTKKSNRHTRNWKQYNRSLVNRGSITFWFDSEAIAKWYSAERTKKPGRPDIYSDDAIRCALIMKVVFHVALRQLQGLVMSLIQILKVDVICPHYSAFSRRAKELDIPMRKFLKRGEHLNIIFDSTGIKVFGEGEWKVRKHGYSKRRTWKKVHVGMCADSGQVIVNAVTSNEISDDTAMIYMMDELNGIGLGDVLGDGAYDTIDCREAIYDRGGRQVIPPKRGARVQRKDPIPCLLSRDKAINRINELGLNGRTQWKKEIGYHRRSLVETFMFRYKTIMGDRLFSRRWQNQITEVKVKLDVINKMTEFGMHESYERVI
jgi:hypothetical protein